VAEAGFAPRGIDDYREVKSRVLIRFRALDAAADPPTAVADLALALLRSPHPPLRNLVGREKIFPYLKRFLPERMWEPQARKYWKITV
jgi:hypothetical protein